MRSCLPILALGLSSLAAPALAQVPPPPDPRTMIVMDGSGSMWGQIDGVPKLEIARRVVAEVLAGIDPAVSLGLMAYGHRRRGDCGDIEVMVAPAPGTAGAIAQAVNTMRFQGRTPLTESVRRAAAALAFSEDPATVILVTDGIETCEADPCALGRELEAAGVNFTAHVVGFGLSAEEGAQVACLAEETGGRYFEANDAAGLAAALTQTLATPPEPEPEPEPEPAPEPAPDMPVPTGGPWYPGPESHTGLQLMATGRSILASAPAVGAINFAADGTPGMCQAACLADSACTAWQFEPQGSYFVAEARCRLFDAGAEFDFGFDEGFVGGLRPGANQLVRPFDAPLPAASVSGPDQVPALSRIVVAVEGPFNPDDYLDIIEAGETRVNRPAVFVLLNGAREVSIQAPAQPGAYDLRYIEARAGAERRVLARQDLSVGAVRYALSAPDAVAAGTPLAVIWRAQGVTDGDYIDIVESGATRTNSALADVYVAQGNPVTLIAPLQAGAYDLRYVVEGPEGRVISVTQSLTVSEPEASLSAPERVAPASPVTVRWTGPATAQNWIDISLPGNQAFSGELTYGYLETGSSELVLSAPDAPGVYELRFVAQDMRGNRAVLARRQIEVSATAAPASPVAPAATK